MKRVLKKHMLSLMAIFALGLLASCTQGDELCDVQEGTAEKTSEVISGTASLDIIEADGTFNTTPGTRTVMQYDNSDSRLKIRWKDGEKIPVFMYFKQGNRSRVIRNVVTMNSNRRLTFDVNIPAGFNRRRGDLYIAAVMGKQPGVQNGAWASWMTSDGKIKIEVSNTADVASEEFNLPCYVPLTPVKPHGSITINFKPLGSWFAVKMNIKQDFVPNHLLLNSDVISTSGTLDLSSSENGDITWSPDPSSLGNIRYNVKNFQVKAKQESQPVIVWFMPILDKKSQQPTTVSLSNNTTYSRTARQYKKITKGRSFDFRNNITYTITVTDESSRESVDPDNGLLITQFHTTLKRSCNRNILQITNTSDHDISLEGYYLVRSVFGSAERASGVIDLGKLEENNAQFLYNDRKKKVLPSGGSLLITGYTRRVAQGTFDRCKNQVYQIALLGEDENLLQQFVPEGNRDRCGRESNCHFCNAYFLTYNGTNISLSKPNDIVDNFGRDACGRIYNFQFLNRTYYRIPYCYIYMGEQGLGGEGTHLYKPERRVRYYGSYWGPMEFFSTCAWRFENENKITSLGFWGKYGDIPMFRNNMY